MENIYPWLVCFDGENHENQVCWPDVLSDTPSSFTRSTPPGLIGSRTKLPTNHPDWLLLYTEPPSFKTTEFEFCGPRPEPTRLRLWNPVTLQSHDLPLLELNYHDKGVPINNHTIGHALLTKAPNDPDCVLLLWVKCRGFFYAEASIMCCRVNGEDDRTWDRRSCPKIGVRSLGSAFYNHVTHHVTRGDDVWIVMSTDTDKDYIKMVKITTTKLGKLLNIISHDILEKQPVSQHQQGHGTRRTICHWVACNGQVFVISIGFGRQDLVISSIVVFKFNFSNETWNIVDSCPNVAFFISPGEDQAISFPIPPANSSNAGNRVYIARHHSVYGEEKRLVLYTYHVQRKTLKVITLLETTPCSGTFKQCYWVLSHVAQEALVNHVTNRSRVEADKKESTHRKSNLVNDRRKFSRVSEEMFNHNLPDDILRTISSYLIRPVDYLNFRAVYPCVGSAKDWRRSAPADNSLSHHPWLMIPSLAQQGVYRMVDPVTNSNYLVKTPKTWKSDSSIRASSNGWLLVSSSLSRENLRLSLYNPITKSTISLPDSVNMDHFFFTSHRFKVVGCKVLGMGGTSGPCLYDYIEHSCNNKIWVERRIDPSDYGIRRRRSRKFNVNVEKFNVNVVYMNGYFYLLQEDGMFRTVNLDTSEDFMLRVRGKFSTFYPFEHRFLVEYGGYILSIHVSDKWEYGLMVFKSTKSKLIWDRVHHLNDNNLYLSNASSIVTKAESPEVGNRIYFPRFYQGSVVYFSMHTNKYHYGDGQVMSSCYGSQEQLYGCWFQPNWDNYDQFSANG